MPRKRKWPAGCSRYPTHNNHSCPKCGTRQLWCHAGGAGDPHAHKCPACGQVWKHEPENVVVDEVEFSALFAPEEAR